MSLPLCIHCKSCIGSPRTNLMCQVCYLEQRRQRFRLIRESFPIQTKQITVNYWPFKPEKQKDHSKCYLCKKKIGILGNLCNGCECSYCNTHRLPEQHKCDVNVEKYIQRAKDEMKKENPNIKKGKIQKI